MPKVLYCRVLGGGPQCQQTVAFIHGFMGDHRDWLPIANELASPQVKVVLVDLPGHGSSPLGENPPRSFDEASEIVWQTIAEHIQGSLTLVAYSLGGRIACRIKAQHDSKIDRLVLESASFGIEDGLEREQRYRKDQRLFSRVLEGQRTFYQFLNTWYQLPLFAALNESPDYSDMIVRRLEQDCGQLSASLAFFSVGCMEYSLKLANNWHGELFYIAGDLDEKYSGIAKSLSSKWHVECIPKASHNVQAQKRPAYLTLLRNILFS